MTLASIGARPVKLLLSRSVHHVCSQERRADYELGQCFVLRKVYARMGNDCGRQFAADFIMPDHQLDPSDCDRDLPQGFRTSQ